VAGAWNLQLLTTVGAVFMALLVIAIRLQAAKKPTSARKILIPPLGMTTGYLMFLVPQTHIPWPYAALAFAAGVLLSYPLIATSKMQILDGKIYLKRSKSFVLILLGLLVLRLILHNYVEQYITIPQTGAIFFILAYGMILPWRIAMYLRYRGMRKRLMQSG
jgi:membrane protein CcdC involved in cytochrome C biogenesis